MPKRLITGLNSWFERDRIVGNLEIFQDFIVISLCLGLFCVMLIRLGDMFFSLLHPLDLQRKAEGRGQKAEGKKYQLKL